MFFLLNCSYMGRSPKIRGSKIITSHCRSQKGTDKLTSYLCGDRVWAHALNTANQLVRCIGLNLGNEAKVSNKLFSALMGKSKVHDTAASVDW